MPVQKHEHSESCKYNDGFLHYLVSAAPNILWYDVQDVGSYQGNVYGVGKYDQKILIYEDYYGSCSGCGAWGEGGEPTNEAEVLSKSHLFETKEEALKYLITIDHYERPDHGKMIQAIDEICQK
jgi:hypothetical protein